LENIKKFKAIVETQLKHNIKEFWSDNSDKFILERNYYFLNKHGIVKQTSNPYRPQENIMAEYANPSTVEWQGAWFMLKKLNEPLWAKAVANAVYTRNQCPTIATLSIISEEREVGEGLTLHKCACLDTLYMCWHLMKIGVNLDVKCTKCFFKGYCECTKAYRLMKQTTLSKVEM
jgi:hypothetical protein